MTTSESYILNVVQNPKLLEIAYRSVEAGNHEESAIESDTGLSSDSDGEGTLDQATDGLLTFGLIGKSDYEYSVEPLTFDTGNWGLDFRMTMLRNVAKSATEPDWGKQSAVVLNYEYLLADTQYFRGTSEELIKDLNEWHQDIEYEPRNNSGERQKLNPEKFNHWRNQAEYLGLIHPTKGRSSTYTVAPDPDLIEASVQTACEEAGGGGGIETSEYVDWLNENLLRIPLTSEREFTKPMASILYRLADSKRIEFVKRGDQEQIGFEGVPTSANAGITKNANYITVDQ